MPATSLAVDRSIFVDDQTLRRTRPLENGVECGVNEEMYRGLAPADMMVALGRVSMLGRRETASQNHTINLTGGGLACEVDRQLPPARYRSRSSIKLYHKECCMTFRISLVFAMIVTLCSFARSQSVPALKSNENGMTFAKMPAGEFMMGRGHTYSEILRLTTIHAGVDRAIKTEVPQYAVYLDSFLLQTTEVTQKQWEDVMGTRPWHGQHSFVKEGESFPAQYVTWKDAVEFCQRLGKADGNTYRLPTEAEWEYACRAGTSTIYSFGDDSSEMEDYGWITDNAYAIGESYAHRVARQKPNPWGLYDMHGNVWEWCADCYQDDYYAASPKDNPLGPERGESRVIRGGSWRSSDTHARSTFRFGFDPSTAENDLGFRVVLELDETTAADDEPSDQPKSR